MRRIEKNRKGFTLAEEVVTVLLIGIASGSNFINSGARLKNQQRKTAAADLDGSGASVSDDTITVTGKDGTTTTFEVQKRSADGFVKYSPKS